MNLLLVAYLPCVTVLITPFFFFVTEQTHSHTPALFAVYLDRITQYRGVADSGRIAGQFDGGGTHHCSRGSVAAGEGVLDG